MKSLTTEDLAPMGFMNTTRKAVGRCVRCEQRQASTCKNYSMQHVDDRIREAVNKYEKELKREMAGVDPECAVGYTLHTEAVKYAKISRVLVEMIEDRKQFFEAEKAHILRELAVVNAINAEYRAKLYERNLAHAQKARSKE